MRHLLPSVHPAPRLDRRAREEDQVLTIQTQADKSAADGAAPGGKGPDTLTSSELLSVILAALSDDKAEEIVEIDLRGKTAIGDYMVICSGRSSRQVSAMADKLVEKLKQEHGRLSRVEGKETGDWVLIDTGDVIVHIFRPEVRDFYQLEKMWLPMPPAQAKPAAAGRV